jgi:chemotaxis protein MotB
MMPRRKKPVEPGGSGGAPEWMVTFSDCMTLLLTFFVLLLSFSSFDKEVFDEFKTMLAGGLPSVNLASKYSKDASSLIERMRSRQHVEQGSDRPTREQGKQAGVETETKAVDFHRHKVFLISSEKIFWGKGTTISPAGHRVLATLALFLTEVQGRLVVSENLPGSDNSDNELGLSRAWAVMEILTGKHGLDKGRFSISASSTVAPVGFGNSELFAGRQRTLEIVLLERSIYR